MDTLWPFSHDHCMTQIQYGIATDMKNKIHMEIEEVLYFMLIKEEIITEQQISYGNCSGGYIAVQHVVVDI